MRNFMACVSHGVFHPDGNQQIEGNQFHLIEQHKQQQVLSQKTPTTPAFTSNKV